MSLGLSEKDEFGSFRELQSRISELEKENSLSLYIRDSRTIEAARKKGLKREIEGSLVYYFLRFACYHGGRRFQSRSTGSRPNQSTYQMECPFCIWIKANAAGTRLVITKIEATHNHEIIKAVVDSLPKRRRLDERERSDVIHMLDRHCNKWLIKQRILRQTGKNITLRDIHNIAYRIQRKSDLQQIEDIVADCTGPDLEITTNDDGKVNGIFFQDDEMKQFFRKYPELVVLDATCKLKNACLALYVMMCVGPNGELEIIAVFLTASKDVHSLCAGLQLFKAKNETWSDIRTVMTDKGTTERDAIRQELGQAAQLLSIFHVLCAVGKDITTAKMSISRQQRLSALKAIQSIAYASTELQYNDLRDCFHISMPENVVRYFEVNWHPIRFEWVQCWQQENVTFGDRTNSRLESVNRRLKAIVRADSSLPVFFKDLIATVGCMRHERDHGFINAVEKVSIKQFPSDSVEAQFCSSVTSFALKFVLDQLDLSNGVEFGIDNDRNLTSVVNGQVENISADQCVCTFSGTMGLPCQHMFAARRACDLPLFSLAGIWPRWLKQSVVESHRILHTAATDSKPVVLLMPKSTKPLTTSEKFKKCNEVVERLTELACEGGTDQFTERYSVLMKLKKIWEDGDFASVSILPYESSMDSAAQSYSVTTCAADCSSSESCSVVDTGETDTEMPAGTITVIPAEQIDNGVTMPYLFISPLTYAPCEIYESVSAIEEICEISVDNLDARLGNDPNMIIPSNVSKRKI